MASAMPAISRLGSSLPVFRASCQIPPVNLVPSRQTGWPYVASHRIAAHRITSITPAISHFIPRDMPLRATVMEATLSHQPWPSSELPGSTGHDRLTGGGRVEKFRGLRRLKSSLLIIVAGKLSRGSRDESCTQWHSIIIPHQGICISMTFPANSATSVSVFHRPICAALSRFDCQ